MNAELLLESIYSELEKFEKETRYYDGPNFRVVLYPTHRGDARRFYAEVEGDENDYNGSPFVFSSGESSNTVEASLSSLLDVVRLAINKSLSEQRHYNRLGI